MEMGKCLLLILIYSDGGLTKQKKKEYHVEGMIH